MKTTEFLKARKDETLAIIEIVKIEFESLDQKLFNTIPAPKKWSVAECIQHLNITLNIYIPQMVLAVQNKNQYFGQKENFRHSFIGKMAVKSMTPKENNEIPMKMKTFKILKPDLFEYSKQEVFDRFFSFQKDIISIIDGCDQMSLEKPKIVTAAGPILKMGFGDALHFMVAHNQRHILQAQNVLKIIN